MGLDVYVDRCRKPKMVEMEDGRKYRSYEEREDLLYWRKNWGLLGIMNYGSDEYGQDVILRKKDMEKILDYLTHNRDYFDSFQSVPDVCDVLDRWDELTADNFVLCFNANW